MAFAAFAVAKADAAEVYGGFPCLISLGASGFSVGKFVPTGERLTLQNGQTAALNERSSGVPIASMRQILDGGRRQANLSECRPGFQGQPLRHPFKAPSAVLTVAGFPSGPMLNPEAPKLKLKSQRALDYFTSFWGELEMKELLCH